MKIMLFISLFMIFTEPALAEGIHEKSVAKLSIEKLCQHKARYWCDRDYDRMRIRNSGTAYLFDLYCH